jgi:E3 ubiquitin-protein ligase DOA10
MTIDLLLKVLTGYSHTISFPEMSFPIILRIRKVMKKSSVSWLKHHLKQIINKVEETSKLVMEKRSKVTFSIKDFELIESWERQNKLEMNPLRQFLTTWKAIQQSNEEMNNNNSSQLEGEDDGNKDISRKRKINETCPVKAKKHHKYRNEDEDQYGNEDEDMYGNEDEDSDESEEDNVEDFVFSD